MPRTVTVDSRLLTTGIGSYLRRTLPGVTRALSEVQFTLLGVESELGAAFGDLANVTVATCRAPIYSLLEQVQIARAIGSNTGFHWTPHFNVPILSRVKQLTTIHDVVFLARPEFFPGGLKRMWARLLFRAAVRKSEQIIAVSRFTAGELHRLLKCDSAKIEVIHNGIDPDFAKFQTEPIPTERPFVLFVGSVKPHKNIGCLLSAIESSSSELTYDLVVAGKSEGLRTRDEAALRALERSGDRVRFLGYVPENLLKNLYAKAACAVFPSHYEGFGYGPLEAMALGCPVLASHIPAHEEVCGEAAFYFDPGKPVELASCLLLIQESEVKRQQLSEMGTARSKAFPAAETAHRTANVIGRLLD